MATKKATYQYDNGSSWDEIMFKTTADQVVLSSGNTIQDFFNSGGTINGNIYLNDKVYSKYIYSTDDFLRLYTMKGEGVHVDTNASRFIPSQNNSLELGSMNYCWKDAWLSSFSRNLNGYTKLTNGMIMQWGTAGYTVDSYGQFFSWVTLPQTFPNKCFSINIQNIWESGFYPMNMTTGIHSIENSKFYAVGRRISQSASQGSFNWIAIGY